jgi:transposase
MADTTLLPGMADEPATRDAPSPSEQVAASLAEPRLRRPDRKQVLMRPCSLEELLPEGHQVRTLWAVVERLDLSAFYAPLKARGEAPGRAATDPKLLVALWLWGATQGVGSARELARLCGEHDAYRWLCGGVSVNYHTLSDFRTDHGPALDELFTQVLAMLMERKLVSVKRISQDGMRVRASAGGGSFKREEKLVDALAAAEAQVEALKLQAEQPENDDRSARQRAARERAARERVQRVEAALGQMPELKAVKERHNGKKSDQPPRASVTDAEARKMKMADGGFRQAYNVQLAADTGSRAIVGVDVSNLGTDQPQSEPMRQQVEDRTRRTGGDVEEHLMDGGFIKIEAIERAEAEGVKVYAPPKKTKDVDDPFAPQPRDTEATAAWRQRMGTPEGQAVYKLRASTSETVNADLRTYRGLGRFLVRGLGKARCVALWSALAYNLMHFGTALLVSVAPVG